MIHLDSCLLIDLLRETSRDRPGPAFDVLEMFGDGEIMSSRSFGPGLNWPARPSQNTKPWINC